MSNEHTLIPAYRMIVIAAEFLCEELHRRVANGGGLTPSEARGFVALKMGLADLERAKEANAVCDAAFEAQTKKPVSH